MTAPFASLTVVAVYATLIAVAALWGAAAGLLVP
ncbi:prepilin peptidase, partial [Streptomyces katsurahamanus]|nr:prepilin peptidase [Streptomyces katsurahamanus]